MDLWDRFWSSGKLEDYIRYKLSSEGKSDADCQGIDNKGGTERGEQ